MAFDPDRRSLLAGLAAFGFTAGCAHPKLGLGASAPGIAVTIDDFDLSDTVLMSGQDRDTAIRAALKHHDVKAGGFVAGKYVNDTLSPRVLARWSEDGHIIGNHSFSHRYFSGQNPDALMADILKCEPLLSAHSSFRKLFRFPYLAEGKTAEGRDAMRTLLQQHGYRNAHVTIDTSDWYIDNRLKARLQENPQSSVDPYRHFYLDHIWSRATFYDGLAKSIFGHSIDHTILLHHRLTTGLFLDDMLSMFSERGWRLVDAEGAFASPVFALEPNRYLPDKASSGQQRRQMAALRNCCAILGRMVTTKRRRWMHWGCSLALNGSHHFFRGHDTKITGFASTSERQGN